MANILQKLLPLFSRLNGNSCTTATLAASNFSCSRHFSALAASNIFCSRHFFALATSNIFCLRHFSALAASNFSCSRHFSAQQQLLPSLSDEDVIFPKEITKVLACAKGDLFLDFTFGAGGHTRRILEDFPSSRVIAVDRDPSTREHAEQLKKRYPKRLCYLNIKFR